METFLGLLIPFAGTTAGAACVFLLKNAIRPLVQRLCWDLLRRDGGRLGLVIADSVHDGHVGFHGKFAFVTGGRGVPALALVFFLPWTV